MLLRLLRVVMAALVAQCYDCNFKLISHILNLWWRLRWVDSNFHSHKVLANFKFLDLQRFDTTLFFSRFFGGCVVFWYSWKYNSYELLIFLSLTLQTVANTCKGRLPDDVLILDWGGFWYFAIIKKHSI